MTSLRYSNDKADIKDFVRSFKKAIPYPMIALAVLLTYFVFPVVSYVNSNEFKSIMGPKNIISYFGETTMFNMYLIQCGMVCCGLLTAIILFRFMFSKKSVNVYFSMGITRTRLFLNRILAGVISLLIGVLVPLTITLIINIVKFGSSRHIYNVFFYLVLAMFTSGLSGFAIGAFASTVSGSIIENVITCISISFIPSIIYSAGVDAQCYLLNGYVRQYNYLSFSSILSPFSFLRDLNTNRVIDGNSMSGYLPTALFSQMLEGKSVPKGLKVDFDVLAPVLLWLIISIVLIGLGFILMNRRKAENANSFGKFYISSAINGTFVFTFFLYVAVEIGTDLYGYKNDNIFGIFYQNLSLILILTCIALFVIFFLAELIIRRKIKGVIRTLPIVAFLLSVTIIYSVYLSSDRFGTYNKLPSQEKIESVSFDFNDARGLFTYSATNNYDTSSSNSYNYESKNADDIKLATELFEAARNEKYDKNGSDYDGSMNFVFKLKDGTVIKRSFDIYTKSVAMDINRKSYESNYYKGLLKALLIDEHKQPDDIDPELDGSYCIDDYGFQLGEFKVYDWYYIGPSLMFESYDRFDTQILNIPPIEDTEGLCKALYEDLIKLPYDKAYNNTSRPLGALMISSDYVFYTDDYMISSYGNMELEELNNYFENESEKKPETTHTAGKTINGIYIYPEMTNTLKFLKDNGIEIAPFEAKVKEVYFANEKMSLQKANLNNCKKLLDTDKDFRQYQYYFNWDAVDGDYSYYSTDSGLYGLYSVYYPYINNVMDDYGSGEYRENVMTLFFDIFKRAGVTLNKITDTKKAEEIASKSVPLYKDISDDDGRFVYIVYDNGIITEQYVPSANIGVLK